MEIKRIDDYHDARFSNAALLQHGAYLIDGEPYEVEITAQAEAVVRGKDPGVFGELIEEFRFHAPHVSRFYDGSGRLIAEYPASELAQIEIDSVQPSQFYTDEDKLRAVGTFVHSEEDVIIQVLPWDGRFICLDGHTRLYLAAQRGWKSVKAVVSETDDWVWTFVHEAQRRNILRPRDMILVPHEQYEELWNKYCDEVFEGKAPQTEEKAQYQS